MYVTVDVEIDDFDTEDIISHLESLGYSVIKNSGVDASGGMNVIFTTQDLFKIKNLSPTDSREYIISLVCQGLSLEYLEDLLCKSY